MMLLHKTFCKNWFIRYLISAPFVGDCELVSRETSH